MNVMKKKWNHKTLVFGIWYQNLLHSCKLVTTKLKDSFRSHILTSLLPFDHNRRSVGLVVDWSLDVIMDRSFYETTIKFPVPHYSLP